MKKKIPVIMIIATLIMAFAMGGCKKDEPVILPAEKTTTNLGVKDVLGVSGTVTFIETSSTSATIEISLSGAPSGVHPAELCMNSAIEGGTAVVILNPVDATGKSSTTITSKTYRELIAYDGFVQVRKSILEPTVILAIGDIGGNVMTSTNKSYSLSAKDASGVTGTALFEKRKNGNTLVTISLVGVISGSYPATINIGSIETVGDPIATKTLTTVIVPVNSTIGKSYTNIKTLNNTNFTITYDKWMEYVGYINIYQNSVAYDNIICHGNIGKS
ncbi:MAG: superoxide dismutase family protein [Paludibacter sp.]|nr:superoxide dismutase family protein [Paludibacter sp.]